MKISAAAKTVIGYRAKAEHDGSFVIGDHEQSREPNDVVCGEVLFGQPIPDEYRRVYLAHHDAISWLIRQVAVVIQPGPNLARDCPDLGETK